jgi:hypothetical protein
MEHDIAGDPITGIKWTRRTTGKIASELQTLGIEVGARTVARLLKGLRYSLRIGIGGDGTPVAPLPHHRTSGSASGGSRS